MLALDQVTVTYPTGLTALADASLAFEPGAFTVLLGASGAGKSTLLNCLNGIVQPTRGRVLGLDGAQIFASRRGLRRHRLETGKIFQQHHLIGRLTALANVLTGRLGFHPSWRTPFPLPKADRIAALEALDRVGLLDRALDRADSLSGGQQQRVGIARALAQRPRIILADEPVASLDPASAEAVLSLLHGICREDGITAVVSLHQVGFARRFADLTYGLCAGRVVFEGDAQALTEAELDRIYRGAGPAARPRSASATERDGRTPAVRAAARRRRAVA